MRMSAWFLARRSTGSSSSPDPDAFRGKLDRLVASLKDVKDWLDDVEKQVNVDAQTELRKEELKEWAYGVEDLLEDVNYEKLRANAAATEDRKSKRDPIADLSGDLPFVRRVDNLLQKLAAIREFDRHLRLGSQLGRQNRSPLSRPSSSLSSDKQVYGREDDKQMLVNFLLSDEITEQKLAIIPVVGAAGVGKTAFVRCCCNDENVRRRFSPPGWVDVETHLEIMGLMGAIRVAVTGKACPYAQLGLLQNLVKQTTKGKRFLLVLDGVRQELLSAWEAVRAAFSDCALGSVIILTTQDSRVADGTKAGAPTFFLESISDENCWLLFQSHAHFPPNVPRFDEIHRKVIEDCQGSPLVAKALGTRLRHEHDVNRCLEILDSEDEVLQGLRSCYSDLPKNLKSCFLYCSMFPRGYHFRENELVRLWMAQGFIPSEKVKSLEEEGSKYFAKLLSGSFFQKAPAASDCFIMPNRLHALAQSITHDEYLTIGASSSNCLVRSDLKKVRHLCLMPTSVPVIEQFFAIIRKLAHFRTILLVPTFQTGGDGQINLPDDAFYDENCLRVLDVSNTSAALLPRTVGKLKHLRYLNLRGTKIRYLHAPVCNLYNLQTLDLSYTEISELPEAIGNLTNLRYLDLNVTKVRKLPESIGKLYKLQTLLLGETKLQELPNTFGGLKGLNFLSLNICNIQRPDSICDLSNLQSLEVRGVEVDMVPENFSYGQIQDAEGQLNRCHTKQNIFDQNVSDVVDSNYFIPEMINNSMHDVETSVLEKLQPHMNLQKLDIRFYGGTRFPKWMECPSYKLTRVILKNCMKCESILQFGLLPHLKELEIDGTTAKVGKEFCHGGQKGAFPSLKKLSLNNMYEWETWEGIKEGDFQCLEELILFNCPKLKTISSSCLLSSLLELRVERCATNAIPCTERLQHLTLCSCDTLRKFPQTSLNSLCSLTLVYCQNLDSLPSIPLIEKLWIEDCDKLPIENASLPSKVVMHKISSTAFIYPAENATTGMRATE